MTQTLDDLRKKIDLIDAKIISSLAERFQITNEVGKYKKEHNLAAQDNAREAAQFAKIEQLSKEAGLNPEFMKKIFRLIIDEVIQNHKKISS